MGNNIMNDNANSEAPLLEAPAQLPSTEFT